MTWKITRYTINQHLFTCNNDKSYPYAIHWGIKDANMEKLIQRMKRIKYQKQILLVTLKYLIPLILCRCVN